jgi:hypothetical protein
MVVGGARRNRAWRLCVLDVLEEAQESMSAQDILDQISARDLRTVTGATPTNTVTTNLLALIEEGRVRRLERGKYGLIIDGDEGIIEVEEEDDTPIVKNFGIGWRRGLVKWGREGVILGSETDGAQPVNIAPFNGIYMLMDYREILYVGRTTARPLGIRLFEHTRGRMGGRWNRFSWFAVDGNEINSVKMIEVLEAVLIESLEPRLNRQGGQQLGPELIQQEDPQFILERQNQLLQEAMQRMANQ